MAKEEAVAVLEDAIERAADERDASTIGRSPAEFVKLDRPL
ncbi:hypothetical protein [Microcoleus sp. D3_18_C4]